MCFACETNCTEIFYNGQILHKYVHFILILTTCVVITIITSDDYITDRKKAIIYPNKLINL